VWFGHYLYYEVMPLRYIKKQRDAWQILNILPAFSKNKIKPY